MAQIRDTKSDTMETVKCKIVSVSNKAEFARFLNEWGYAFRRVYSDLCHNVNVTNKDYQNGIVENYPILNKISLRSLLTQVKMTKDAYDTITNQLIKKRKTLQEKCVDSKENTVLYHRLCKKLNSLDRQIERREKGSITFGGNILLRKIAYLSNLSQIKTEEEWRSLAIKELRKNNPYRCLTERDILERITNRKQELKELSKLKAEYQSKRYIQYYSVGDSGECAGNHNCNKFFELHLKDKYVIFKPKKEVKCRIDFTTHDKVLEKLDTANYNKQLPITVSFDNENIYFSFDTFRLCHNLPKVDKKNIKNTIQLKAEKIEELYSKRCGRYVGAIDINPLELGFALIKLKGNGKFEIVKSLNYNWSRIHLKKGVKSTDKRYKSAAKHLKLEMSLIAKNIINIMNYYNARYFVMDNLDNLSAKGDLTKNKTLNKMFAQQWLKDDIMYQLRKRCNESGIQLLENIPNAYSSVIGNFSFGCYDSVNAAIEMARRGANSVKNDNFDYKDYIRVDDFDKQNIAQFFRNRGAQGDVSFTEWKTFWKTLNKDLKRSYRNKEKNECCVKRGLGYKSITRVENYNLPCIEYPIEKHLYDVKVA